MALIVPVIVLVVLLFGSYRLLFSRYGRKPSVSDREREFARGLVLKRKESGAMRKSERERILDEVMEFVNEEEGDEASRRKILILYATEYGFGKEVARKTAESLREVVCPRVMNMRDFECVDWAKEKVLLVVCSTTGDGVLPNDAKRWYDELTKLEEGKAIGQLRFSVLALGDRSYPHFCRGGITMEEALLRNLPGQAMLPRKDIDQEDWDDIELWIEKIQDQMKAIEFDHKVEEDEDYLRKAILSSKGALSHGDKYTRDHPLLAPLVQRHSLCSPGSEKETIYLEFDVSSADGEFLYEPGDAVGVIPQNCPDEVEEILLALAADGSELVNPPKSVSASGSLLPDLISLRSALTSHFDLKSIKPELIEFLHLNTSDPDEKEHAKMILDASHGRRSERFQEYASDRHVIDVLSEFPNASYDPQDLTKYLRPLTARYYSIASSPKQKSHRVSIAVAVLRYKLRGVARKGVASTYLCERVPLESSVGIFVSRNNDFRLPVDPNATTIMVGPGTGVAPFISFLYQRTSLGASGRNILFFGCRRRDEDFLFCAELEEFESRGEVELITAFSREKNEKIYVQDKIRENRERIWEAIEAGAHVYVCGDGARMAPDVHETLVTLARELGTQSEEAARGYLTELERHHRYQRDVWIV